MRIATEDNINFIVRPDGMTNVLKEGPDLSGTCKRILITHTGCVTMGSNVFSDLTLGEMHKIDLDMSENIDLIKTFMNAKSAIIVKDGKNVKFLIDDFCENFPFKLLSIVIKSIHDEPGVELCMLDSRISYYGIIKKIDDIPIENLFYECQKTMTPQICGIL